MENQVCIGIYGFVIKRGLFLEYCKNWLIKNLNNKFDGFNPEDYIGTEVCSSSGIKVLKHSGLLKFMNEEKYLELGLHKSFFRSPSYDIDPNIRIVKCNSRNHDEFDGHFTFFIGVIFCDISLNNYTSSNRTDITNLFGYNKILEKLYSENSCLFGGIDEPTVHYTFNVSPISSYVLPNCCAYDEVIAYRRSYEFGAYENWNSLSPILPLPPAAVRQPSSGIPIPGLNSPNSVEFEDFDSSNLRNYFSRNFILMNENEIPSKRRRLN